MVAAGSGLLATAYVEISLLATVSVWQPARWRLLEPFAGKLAPAAYR